MKLPSILASAVVDCHSAFRRTVSLLSHGYKESTDLRRLEVHVRIRDKKDGDKDEDKAQGPI